MCYFCAESLLSCFFVFMFSHAGGLEFPTPALNPVLLPVSLQYNSIPKWCGDVASCDFICCDQPSVTVLQFCSSSLYWRLVSASVIFTTVSAFKESLPRKDNTAWVSARARAKKQSSRILYYRQVYASVRGRRKNNIDVGNSVLVILYPKDCFTN